MYILYYLCTKLFNKMDITLAIVAAIIGTIGLLGVIIPVLPGTILSFG